MTTTPYPKFLNPNLAQTELRNAKMQNLATAPSSPVTAQMYFDTTLVCFRHWTGTEWYNHGNVNFRPGGYNVLTDYKVGDAIGYSGSTYVMTADGPAGTIPTDTNYWTVLAEGGMAATYTNSTPMPVALGGYAAGTTFSARPNDQMWTGFLYPYQSPAFSSFSVTGQSTTVEVGTSISGSKTFTWATSNPSNVKPGSVSISQGGTTLVSGLNGSGSTSVTVTTVQNNSPASQVWTITGQNTNNVNFSTTFTVTWQYKKYYGTSANGTLTSSDILALANSALGSSASGNYAQAAGDYKFLVFPQAWTAPSAIKDQNTLLAVDLENTGTYTNTTNGLTYENVTVTNSLGVSAVYRVYRSKNKLGGALTEVVS